MNTVKIKTVMLEKNMNGKELAKKLNTSQQNLSNKLSADNFKTSDLQAIAEALGCELRITFIDKETGKEF